jgi:hypothetical protein
MTTDGRQILTRHVFPDFPATPDRPNEWVGDDWVAFFDGDGDGGLRGWGKTRDEAVANLTESLRGEKEARP